MNIVKSDRTQKNLVKSNTDIHMKSAQDHIYASIKELSNLTNGRDDIKSSIADLSTVLFDLKSMKQ